MATSSLTQSQNNPGKLQYDPTDRYVVGNGSGYGIYTKPDKGIAAMMQRFYDIQKQGYTTSQDMLMRYLKTASNDPSTKVASDFMYKNAGFVATQNVDFKNYRNVLSWASNFILLLNDAPLYAVNTIITGCAISLNVDRNKFAQAVQPARYSWQNGYVLQKTADYVSPATASLVNGGSSLLSESSQQRGRVGYVPYVNNSGAEYYWLDKNIKSNGQTKEAVQPGTLASSVRDLAGINQDAIEIKKGLLQKQIADIQTLIFNQEQTLASTTDPTKQVILTNSISEHKIRRQELIESLVAMNSAGINNFNTHDQPEAIGASYRISGSDSNNANVTLSQRDLDASITSDYHVQLPLELVAGPDTNTFQPNKAAAKQLSETSNGQQSQIGTGAAPVGGGYQTPGTGSATIGASIFGRPVIG